MPNKVSKTVIYQSKSGAIELKGDIQRETVWATQAQIVKLFDVDQSVVSRHINNAFRDREIEAKSNMQKMHIANSDKPVVLYSLDVVLSVGYRTNSLVAIEFRKWATKTLRHYIVDGFVVNQKRIAVNYKKFLTAIGDIKACLPAESAIDAKDAMELATLFADTWLSLDAYDRDAWPTMKPTKKKVDLTAEQMARVLLELRAELIRKSEASDIFGTERVKGNVAGIVGNVMQSFGGKELYPTLEEKAANLLYFMVKNHPFVDGNKRSGAFAFIWFLNQFGKLDSSKLTPSALTALTVLVAESNPQHKERLIRLILNLIV